MASMYIPYELVLLLGVVLVDEGTLLLVDLSLTEKIQTLLQF